MQTKHKFLLSFYVIIFCSLVIIATFPDELRPTERTIELNSVVSANKILLFNQISDVEKYPMVLPDTFISVDILDKTNNSIKTLETAKEMGIEQTLQIQHDLIPTDSHEITILNGDAKGTKIIIWFYEIDENTTRISAKLDLHLEGLLIPFGLLPESNFQHAFDTILDRFVEYVNINYDLQ
jgi:ribosome-associated toxin RatA of RatAB toxin-antitoxin module